MKKYFLFITGQQRVSCYDSNGLLVKSVVFTDARSESSKVLIIIRIMYVKN